MAIKNYMPGKSGRAISIPLNGQGTPANINASAITKK
jgi:hypothetical protein